MFWRAPVGLLLWRTTQKLSFHWQICKKSSCCVPIESTLAMTKSCLDSSHKDFVRNYCGAMFVLLVLLGTLPTPNFPFNSFNISCNKAMFFKALGPSFNSIKEFVTTQIRPIVIKWRGDTLSESFCCFFPWSLCYAVQHWCRIGGFVM